MPSINIDVDIDVFDTNDLIMELKYRFTKDRIFKSDKKLLQTFCIEVLKSAPSTEPWNGTLLDQLKLECYTEHKDRFTLTELQERLK